MNTEKIIDFYKKFIITYDYVVWDRCICEQYRNDLAKAFGFPQGHRWKYDEWWVLQDEAFELLVKEGKITEEEKKFYCLRFKF